MFIIETNSNEYKHIIEQLKDVNKNNIVSVYSTLNTSSLSEDAKLSLLEDVANMSGKSVENFLADVYEYEQSESHADSDTPEFIGQLIDIIEDEFCRIMKTDDDTVLIEGDKYNYIKNKIRILLEDESMTEEEFVSKVFSAASSDCCVNITATNDDIAAVMNKLKECTDKHNIFKNRGHLYNVFIDSGYIRDAQIAQTDGLDDEEIERINDIDDPDMFDRWTDYEPTDYQGTVRATSERHACAIAAEKYGLDIRILYAARLCVD